MADFKLVFVSGPNDGTFEGEFPDPDAQKLSLIQMCYLATKSGIGKEIKLPDFALREQVNGWRDDEIERLFDERSGRNAAVYRVRSVDNEDWAQVVVTLDYVLQSCL
jgi:hypothetical protein